MSESTTQNNETRRLRLDDASLENYAAPYPDNVRKPTVWLGQFVREKCSGKIDILVTKVKELKKSCSYSTFHKILTGKYFLTREGKTVGSVENFLEVVDALKKQDELAEAAGKVPFITTPTSTKISEYIDGRRATDRICKFGVIVGHTGSQKTASFKQYCALNNHGMCVHVEAPWRPSMPQFITDLAIRYGVPREEARRKGMAEVLKQVNHTKTIIIDNVQRLYNPERGSDQPVFNFLQKLQDDTSCTIILSFTPDFIDTLAAKIEGGYFEQFEGRAGGLSQFLILPAWPTKGDVLAIAKAFLLKHAEKHVDELQKFSNSRGRIRILFDALQNAKQIATAENMDLTIEHVREVLPEEEKEEKK